MQTNLTFGAALELLKAGSKIARNGWNGKGMYLQYMEPVEGNPITRPFIAMFTVDAQLVPWTASQTDVLAADWMEVVN